MDVTDIKLQTVEIFWEREKKLLKLLFFLILFLCCDVFVTSDWHGQTFSNPGPSKMERDKKCKQHNGRRKSKNLPNDENEWTCRLVNSFFLSLFCSELSLEKISDKYFSSFPFSPTRRWTLTETLLVWFSLEIILSLSRCTFCWGLGVWDELSV